jgi:hypothetical protein
VSTPPLPSTPGPFAAWLRWFAPEAVVGETCNTGRCPLAAYLLHLGAKFPDVCRLWYRVTLDGAILDLPGWARDFLKRIDGAATEYGCSVTAAECLAVLERPR